MRFNANVSLDVADVAALFNLVPEDAQPACAAGLLALGLMTDPRPSMRFALWIARKRGVAYDVMLQAFKRDRKAASELVTAAGLHCWSGKDKTSKQSAGGWNQGELDKAVALLAGCGLFDHLAAARAV